MKKNKKNNETKKIIVISLAIALIIILIGGATFAYWSWQSNNAQKTNVTVTVKGATFNIVGNNISNTGMYPTNDCDGAGALIGEVATMTVVNETESPMTASLKIRASLVKSHNYAYTITQMKLVGGEETEVTEDSRIYLKWAIVDTSTTATCESTGYKGTLAGVETNTDIDTGITFTAPGTTKGGTAVTTTKTYRIYVWLDPDSDGPNNTADTGYSHTNTGNTINDPMEDLKISVKWSPASTLIQG